MSVGSAVTSLEEVWEYREEGLYPKLFGKMQRGIFSLSYESFTSLSAHDVDPRWLHLGVFEFGPTVERKSWLYVTSGGSTPWELDPSEYDPEEYSWLGVEFVMETSQQADWPIRVLQRLLAYHVLVCHGAFGDFPPLNYGHRVPAGGPIDGANSSLRFLAIVEPTHYASSGQLGSGKFDFLQVVGITEGERDYAKASSTGQLVAALSSQGAYPVTNPQRAQIAL
jgi:hypothetical protein